eukprot:SAG31_NODE_1281_length_9019_cov_4.758072_2_plen_171_part_00
MRLKTGRIVPGGTIKGRTGQLNHQKPFNNDAQQHLQTPNLQSQKLLYSVWVYHRVSGFLIPLFVPFGLCFIQNPLSLMPSVHSSVGALPGRGELPGPARSLRRGPRSARSRARQRVQNILHSYGRTSEERSTISMASATTSPNSGSEAATSSSSAPTVGNHDVTRSGGSS